MISCTFTDMLAYGPINHWGNEKTNPDCAYRIRNIIQSMVQAIGILREQQIDDILPNRIADRMGDYYTAKSPKIKDRILIVNKEAYGEKIEESTMQNHYPYKYGFCTQEKISKAIHDKDSSYYYYQPGMTQNKSFFVFDPPQVRHCMQALPLWEVL